jgi:hypothetical protein
MEPGIFYVRGGVSSKETSAAKSSNSTKKITLTPEEVAERRAKQLCFHSRDRYSLGHIFKKKLFSMEVVWGGMKVKKKNLK